MRPLPLLLALLLAPAALFDSAAHADVLWFKNGRSLEGTVRDLPGGKVEIILPYGSLAFSRAQVDRVEKAVSVAEIVDQALATLRPADLEQLFELAEWCREKREHTLAQRLYRHVLARDPDHAGARQRLGHERHNGVWMSSEEVRRARGEVQFRGRWVVAEAIRHTLEAERAEERLERLERLEEARLALELTRLELETERALHQPPSDGVPIYPFVAAPGSSGHFLPTFKSAPPDGRRRVPASSPARGAEAEEPRRHESSIPRHLRGGFVAPRRR